MIFWWFEGRGENTAHSRHWRGHFSVRFGSQEGTVAHTFATQEGSLSCFNQPRGQCVLAPKRTLWHAYWLPRGHFSMRFGSQKGTLARNLQLGGPIDGTASCFFQENRQHSGTCILFFHNKTLVKSQLNEQYQTAASGKLLVVQNHHFWLFASTTPLAPSPSPPLMFINPNHREPTTTASNDVVLVPALRSCSRSTHFCGKSQSEVYLMKGNRECLRT